MKKQQKIEFKYSEDAITFEEFNDNSFYIKYPAYEKELEKQLNRIINRNSNISEPILVLKYYFCVIALSNNYMQKNKNSIIKLFQDTIEELTNKKMLLEVIQLLPMYTSSSKGQIAIIGMNTNHVYNTIKLKIKNSELDDELDHLLNELFERARENDKNNQK